MEEPEVPPDQFVREIYEIAARRHQRGSRGIFPSDLLYDMVPSPTNDLGVVWWMHHSHPIALMLVDNDIEDLGTMRSSLGHIVIFSDEQVKECRDVLISLCDDYGLKIQEEPVNVVVEK